jgi:CubicO group peptidase (beta-lactamase class C family)
MLATLLASCSLLEPDVESYDDLEQAIAREVEAHNLPSLAAVFVKNERIVWEGYYGLADVQTNRPANVQTIYGLASVSKLVIVTAVMQLVERGVLRLEADVNEYLPYTVRNPSFPDRPITLEHLLTHTSGLAWPVNNDVVPGYYQPYPGDSSPPLGEWIRELIQPGGSRYARAVWKDVPPGHAELYSNLGVSVAAYVVESVTGLEFSEYCRRHVFDPLDMSSTSFRYDELDGSQLAIQYEDSGAPMRPYRYGAYPAGDLKSSARDFSRLLSAYLNGGVYAGIRILAEETVAETLRMRNPVSGLCLIWNRTVGEWYGHAGGKPGVASYAEIQPEHELGLIVVTNRRNGEVYPGNRIHALLRRIAREYLQETVDASSG